METGGGTGVASAGEGGAAAGRAGAGVGRAGVAGLPGAGLAGTSRSSSCARAGAASARLAALRNRQIFECSERRRVERSNTRVPPVVGSAPWPGDVFGEPVPPCGGYRLALRLDTSRRFSVLTTC